MTYRVHETDLQLVDALQVNPRATWAEVGAALGVSAVTAARRWNRLEEQGLAWVNAAIGPERSMGAVLEVRCAPSDTEDVARALARFPNIITVGATTGDFQVFAILLATDLQELMRTLARKFTPVKGAVRIRHNIFRLLYGGVHWRQGVLSPGESRIMEPDPSPNRPRVRPLGIEDRALFRHLNRRGRATPTEIAAELGLSQHRVRRRLNELSASQEIIFRCDVARPLFDLPLGVYLQLKAPDTTVGQAASELGRWRETRLCANAISASNIILVIGLHQLSELEEVQSRIAERFPDVSVEDRRVILRYEKIYGRVLDDLGRCVETVPVDPWTDSV
ncbi:DNA-binding Lrp family transcriptional regulator [Spinactinospora alkalitolerans]|uniref:DNA-binding Lrp family transcriptional regulator n=1 Tax=Spinactinospora alkalitolerans TaxID=687207 RepID=A0A852TX60_9ACTN|nr:AsnC family transcriptional regulator [Spinactinospora alkalitolerans]NYE47887.1 DNA-binding Lrp family transcriptional regulator [Spinactinospora alkalitolerans]